MEEGTERYRGGGGVGGGVGDVEEGTGRYRGGGGGGGEEAGRYRVEVGRWRRGGWEVQDRGREVEVRRLGGTGPRWGGGGEEAGRYRGGTVRKVKDGVPY